MSDLPSHPDTDDARPAGPDQAIAAGSRRRRVLTITAAAILVVVVIVLHLAGVLGAESH